MKVDGVLTVTSCEHLKPTTVPFKKGSPVITKYRLEAVVMETGRNLPSYLKGMLKDVFGRMAWMIL